MVDERDDLDERGPREEVEALMRVLLHLRRKAGLTQREVAERMGWTERRYGNYERGIIRTFPPPRVIRLLAAALGVKSPEILRRVGYLEELEPRDPAYVFSSMRQSLAEIEQAVPGASVKVLEDAIEFAERRWQQERGS